jgi:chromosomal replication initiator protein
MYLARKITRHSLGEVGGHFGGRDHSTVLYAVTKISGLAERDPETAELLSRLLERLGERPL